MRKIMITVFLLFLAVGVPGCGEEKKSLYPSDLSEVTKVKISTIDSPTFSISTTNSEIIKAFFETIPNEEKEYLTTEEYEAFVFTSCSGGEWQTLTNSLRKQFTEKYLITLSNSEGSTYLYGNDFLISKDPIHYDAISLGGSLDLRIQTFALSSIKDNMANSPTVYMQMDYNGIDNAIDITDEARIIAENITFEDADDITDCSPLNSVSFSEGDSELRYFNDGFYITLPTGEKKIPVSQEILSRINAKIASLLLTNVISDVDHESFSFYLANNTFDKYSIYDKTALRQFFTSLTYLETNGMNYDFIEFSIESSSVIANVNSNKLVIKHGGVDYGYTVATDEVNTLWRLLITDVFRHAVVAPKYEFLHRSFLIDVPSSQLESVKSSFVYNNIEIVDFDCDSYYTIEYYDNLTTYDSCELYYKDGYVAIRVSYSQFARMPLSIECNELFADIFSESE